MISEDFQFVVCDEIGCDEKVKNHRWGKTKADGWFFGQDQATAWCPKHIPRWVRTWRAKQERT